MSMNTSFRQIMSWLPGKRKTESSGVQNDVVMYVSPAGKARSVVFGRAFSLATPWIAAMTWQGHDGGRPSFFLTAAKPLFSSWLLWYHAPVAWLATNGSAV